MTDFMESNSLHSQGHLASWREDHASQLFDRYDEIVEALETKQKVDIIYTDIVKAFDSYDHDVDKWENGYTP